MAFVQPSTTSLLVSSFVRPAIDTKPRRPSAVVANIRMSINDGESEEPKAVGVQGQSMWKESPFYGGFPGGEEFLRKWLDGGMTEDVPDMPQKLQPSSRFVEQTTPNKGILSLLDKTEFFKDFIGQTPPEEDAGEEEAEDSEDGQIVIPSGPSEIDLPPNRILYTEIPNDELYSPYFPTDIKDLAPEIIIDYKGTPYDRVGVAMTEVTASYTDVYYPKETKNKAPVIDINYNGYGYLGSAYISVCLDEIEPMPTISAPPRPGDVVTSVVPGNSGGLKLKYCVDGEEIKL